MRKEISFTLFKARKMGFAAYLLFICLTIFVGNGAFADDIVDAYISWETQSNPTVVKDESVLRLLHYEIPFDLVSRSVIAALNPDVEKALVFVRDGKKYIRWIIHPDDEKWHPKVKKLLKKKGVDSEPKTYLEGHYTSSRSMVVRDPATGYEFGVKVSTNKTGGFWNSFKRQRWNDAVKIRRINDFLQEASQKIGFQHFTFMPEVAAYGLEGINQALVVRSLDGAINSRHHYLPAFAAIHTETGAEIAKVNGSENPVEFWNKHLNVPLGRALAEFAAIFGFVFNSPHSQNFLVELNENMKPTGRIVLRDIGDLYIVTSVLREMGREDIIRDFNWFFKVKKTLRVSVALLHGTYKPEWMTWDDYRSWGKSFFEAFEATFSEITGVSRRRLSSGDLRVTSISPLANFSSEYIEKSDKWFSKNYSRLGEEWLSFRKWVRERLPGNVSEIHTLSPGARCRALFGG